MSCKSIGKLLHARHLNLALLGAELHLDVRNLRLGVHQLGLIHVRLVALHRQREAAHTVELHRVAVGHLVAQHVRQRVEHCHDVGNRHRAFLLDALRNLAGLERLGSGGHGRPLDGHFRITFSVVSHNLLLSVNGLHP